MGFMPFLDVIKLEPLRARVRGLRSQPQRRLPRPGARGSFWHAGEGGFASAKVMANVNPSENIHQLQFFASVGRFRRPNGGDHSHQRWRRDLRRRPVRTGESLAGEERQNPRARGRSGTGRKIWLLTSSRSSSGLRFVNWW